MRKLETIVVPVDFSEDSVFALREAAALARRYGARLHLLNVIEIPTTLDKGSFSPDPRTSRPEPNQALESERRMRHLAASFTDVQVIFAVRIGNPGEEINAYAFSVKADAVVIASHGHRSLRRVILGSTTTTVVRGAMCPVLVVRHPKRIRKALRMLEKSAV